MVKWRVRFFALLLAITLIWGAPSHAHAEEAEALKQGSAGERVVELQLRLRQLGFLHDRADGKYGLKTARAVRAFQRQAALSADATAGADTLSALNSPDAPEARVFIAPSGKRYHARANCRGLNAASSVDETGFFSATVEKNRTPCKICYGAFALQLALEQSNAQAKEAASPAA